MRCHTQGSLGRSGIYLLHNAHGKPPPHGSSGPVRRKPETGPPVLVLMWRALSRRREPDEGTRYGVAICHGYSPICRLTEIHHNQTLNHDEMRDCARGSFGKYELLRGIKDCFMEMGDKTRRLHPWVLRNKTSGDDGNRDKEATI